MLSRSVAVLPDPPSLCHAGVGGGSSGCVCRWFQHDLTFALPHEGFQLQDRSEGVHGVLDLFESSNAETIDSVSFSWYKKKRNPTWKCSALADSIDALAPALPETRVR